MGERYVLLGVAPARVEWFGRVTGWSASAALPVEFVRCVSLEEVAARLAGDRRFSAVLVDAGTSGFDRDAIRSATDAGCAVVVVDGPEPRRPWVELGAAAVLPPGFCADDLLGILAGAAARVPTASLDLPDRVPWAEAERGRLVAVTGPGGTGASVLAIALAQGLASGEAPLSAGSGDPGDRRPSVLLADLCRVADQALYHDAQRLVPGVQELVEAHRTSRPPAAEVWRQTFEVPSRGYRLLLGLRRPRHWAGLRAQAIEATLGSLRSVSDVVVADVEADVEGQAETGSLDVQDRHQLARSTLGQADLVLVVGEPSMKGTAALVRMLAELVAFGVEPERLQPVVNRSPRSPRRRAELTATVAELLPAATAVRAERFVPVLHLPERDLEGALRDGVALTGPLPRTLARASAVHLARGATSPPGSAFAPVPVRPGSLSTFTAQEPPHA